jgi:hypothetical protein
MAERSGNKQLDALIEAFIRRGTWYESVPDWLNGGHLEVARSLDVLRTPRGASNKCVPVTGEFNRFLQEHGWPASCAGERDDRRAITTPDELGYRDRRLPGYDAHTLTITQAGGLLVAIDWACAQYGYHEFPLVQFLIDGRWQRERAGVLVVS